jgi:hypothetical protein
MAHLPSTMSWTATLVCLGVAVSLAVLCGWRGARAPDLHRGPRMVPYRMLMVLASAWALLMLVHLVNLMGITTGR